MSMQKLSPAQAKALRNLAFGRPSAFGLTGRSAMGGHTRVMVSLYNRGLVDEQHEITVAGRSAIANPAS